MEAAVVGEGGIKLQLWKPATLLTSQNRIVFDSLLLFTSDL